MSACLRRGPAGFTLFASGLTKSQASLFCVLLAVAVLAQAAPPSPLDAERLRQQQRARSLQDTQQLRPALRQPGAPPGATTGHAARLDREASGCHRIERLVLEGDAAQDFQWALDAAGQTPDGSEDPALGQCLGPRALAQVLQRVQQRVIGRGYVTTRVLAPAQDLSSGSLRLQLIPGRVRNIRVDNPRATLWNAMPARPGEVLQLQHVEQGLENLRRLSTVQADVQLQAAHDAQQQGDTDILIRWEQPRPWRISAFLDDSGSRATGRMMGGVTLSCEHCLALNDIFYLSHHRNLGDLGGAEPGARGTRARSLHYSLPLRHYRLGLQYSRYNSRQTVAGLNQPYLYSGESESGELSLSRTVLRTAAARSTVALKGWLRSSRNFIDDTEIEVQRRRMAGWELDLRHEQLLGQATLDAGLAYRRGTGAFHARPGPEEDLLPGVSRPQVINADLQLNLPFQLGARGIRYAAHLRAQWSRTPLLPQDQFAIGGRHTVRGFDGERFLSAERGWLLRNELATLLPGGHEIYFGVDHGEVHGPNTATLIGTRLTGTVIGWRGNIRGLGFDLFAATPLHKPDGFFTANITTGFNLNYTY